MMRIRSGLVLPIIVGLLAVAILDAAPTNADHGLLVVSTVFIILTLVAYFIREFIQPLARRHLMLKWAVQSDFVIVETEKYKNDFVIQDDDEHLTSELIVPPHEDVYIHLRFKNRFSFTQYHFALYFSGDIDKKPTVENFHLKFVRRGQRRDKSPETDSSHYIDYHGCYHIEETKHRAWGDYFVYAFNIKTREPGTYNAEITINADGVSAVSRLKLRVEPYSSQRMRCTCHWGCFIRPDASGWHKRDTKAIADEHVTKLPIRS
jgi:hypothetical protein